MTHPTEKGLIAWMARNPVAANLLLLIVFAAGLSSLPSLKKEIFPTFPADTLTVTVPYPGSSPEEVEQGILLKIEEAVQDIQGIEKITAIAEENSGRVVIEVAPGENFQTVFNRVKVRVDSIANFPAESERPVIEENTPRTRVINLSVYGPLDEAGIKQLTEQIRDELLLLPDITQVDIEGDRDYEISIEVPDQVLRSYGLSFDDLVTRIRNQSKDLPGGKIRTDNGAIVLRSEGQARSASDFSQLVIISGKDGTAVTLGDIATIRDGFTENPVLSLLNGFPSQTITVSRVGKQNPIAISEQVRNYIAERSESLPEGVSLSAWGDRSAVLKGRIQLLLKNAAQGSFLVLIILALFLQPRLAFWVVVGVPFCFLGTLFVMDLLSFSINVISLFAFILVLGIVVDDAIVTAESAYASLEQENEGIDSIIRGVKKVAVATVFGVITTIIAFFPMLFLTEGISRFFKVISIVVICCLLFSIIESKLILPTHLRHMKIADKNQKGIRHFFSESLGNFARHRYQPVLLKALKYRYITLALFLCFLMIAKQLVPSGLVRFIFFPNVPSDYIEVSLQMPPETPYKLTHEYALLLQQSGLAINDRYRQQTGSARNVIENLQVLSENDTSANLKASLIPSTERSITSVEMAQWWRENLPELPGIKSLSFDANAGHPSIPIDIQLEAVELDTLRMASLEIKEALRDYGGVYDIRDTFDAGAKEIDIRLSAEGEAMGLGQTELARQVRQAFFGAEIQRLQRDRHEIRVYTRYPEAERDNLATLEDMWIHIPGNEARLFAPLSSLAELETREGLNKITRIDRQRVVNIQASVDKAKIEPGKILESLKADRLPAIIDKYPGLTYRFSGESEDEGASMQVFYTKGIVMLLMIYAALAIPLKSYSQPLIIMSVIPFGLLGAIIGHFIVGLEISILSIIGMIALAGIVVNDSLVLVDYINQHVRSGEPYLKAVAHSGVRRFRAVILTSATTFAGLLPLQLETSIQAQFLKPMAISVAFGVLFATLVTLMLVPVLCHISHDIRNMLRAIHSWLLPPTRV